MYQNGIFAMKVGLYLAIALYLCGNSGWAAKLDKANLVSDAGFLMHLDLDAVRKSKIGSTLIKWTKAKEGNAHMIKIKKGIGFDPSVALNSVTMSGNGKEDNGIMILKHNAETKKVLSLIKSQDGYWATDHTTKDSKGSYKIHSVGEERGRNEEKPDERGYISFVDKNTAVMAPSRKLAAKAIDLVKGKGALKRLFPQVSTSIKESKLPFLIGYADIDQMQEVIEDPNIKDMAREVAFVLGETDGDLVINARIVAQSVETAEYMHNMINGLIGFASLNQKDNPEVMDLLKSMKISRKQATVSALFKMSVDKILEYADPELKQLDIDLGIDLNK